MAPWSPYAKDRPTGSWIVVANHDDTLGPATGGCRMKVYDRPEEGLRDAMRLARGMTHKWAATGLPVGGGKSVRCMASRDARQIPVRIRRSVCMKRFVQRWSMHMAPTRSWGARF